MPITFQEYIAINEAQNPSKDSDVVKSLKELIKSALDASKTHEGTELGEYFKGKLEGLEIALKVVTEGY